MTGKKQRWPGEHLPVSVLPGSSLWERCGGDSLVNIREAPWGSGDFAVSSMLSFLFHSGDCTTMQ